jgi:hypothetical protein
LLKSLNKYNDFDQEQPPAARFFFGADGKEGNAGAVA